MITIAKNGRVRICDIAKRARVAPVTVSNILNHSLLPYNRKTRERIFRIARQLDYHPNIVARSMRTRRTYLVGLLAPDVVGNYFADIIYAVERRLEPEGYQVLLCQSHRNLQTHENLIHVLQQRQVDGLLIAVVDSTAHTHLYNKLQAMRTPFVLYDSGVKGLKCSVPLVESNQPRLTQLAVEHLWELGHRDIFFLKGFPHFQNAEERRRGFLDAMRKRGVAAPSRYLVEAGYDEEGGCRGLDALLSSGRKFTAMVASSISCGYGVLKRAEELGLKTPENFSLVTIGGGREAARMQLTDVDQRPQEIGTKMAETLLAIMQRADARASQGAGRGPSLRQRAEEPFHPTLHELVEPALNVRRSTEPCLAASRARPTPMPTSHRTVMVP